ncbi:hypothetical protein BOTCAL_0221g00030 [Botryotinia calthae]|uniref:Uncharacterized protein n=1 Tax=Botryotinia calthae TaxID=38488 RepID=A0A4Y8CYD5_9HELO|nr:hypothetical protein BOTCAL_0221g00030 [Botryotinia calthae]
MNSKAPIRQGNGSNIKLYHVQKKHTKAMTSVHKLEIQMVANDIRTKERMSDSKLINVRELRLLYFQFGFYATAKAKDKKIRFYNLSRINVHLQLHRGIFTPLY